MSWEPLDPKNILVLESTVLKLKGSFYWNQDLHLRPKGMQLWTPQKINHKSHVGGEGIFAFLLQQLDHCYFLFKIEPMKERIYIFRSITNSSLSVVYEIKEHYLTGFPKMEWYARLGEITGMSKCIIIVASYLII